MIQVGQDFIRARICFLFILLLLGPRTKLYSRTTTIEEGRVGNHRAAAAVDSVLSPTAPPMDDPTVGGFTSDLLATMPIDKTITKKEAGRLNSYLFDIYFTELGYLIEDSRVID